jgi:anion transporter
MNLAEEIPILSGLSNVDLAKLIVDLEPVHLSAEDALLSAELDAWVYFIVRGTIAVTSQQPDGEVTVLTIGEGQLVGDWAFSKAHGDTFGFRALTPTQLYRIPRTRFNRMLQSDQKFSLNYVKLVNMRASEILFELTRRQRMLDSYATEVWNAVPVMEPTELAAALASGVAPQKPAVAEAPSTQPHKRIGRFDHAGWKLGSFLVGTGLSILTYKLLHVPSQLASVCAILVWAAWNWVQGVIPEYIIALATALLIVLLKASTPAVAFSGFASPSWFLLLGVLGLGVAISRSGLLYRIALHLLRLLPPTYIGQSFALAITGLLFTPLLPSANSRSAIASPLARELSEAMRFPQLGNGSAGLAMSSFLGFGQMYFMFFNGTNICMLAWSLLPPVTRQQVTWTSWFWIALPLGLITFFGSYLAIVLLFRPETTRLVSRETTAAQLKVLGPFTKQEKITAGALGFMLIGFVTQNLHGLDPAWIALPAFLFLVAVGTIDKNGLRAMDWGFLLLVGSLVSLSEVTRTSGFSDLLTRWVRPLFLPLGSSPYLFLGSVALLMIITRLAIPIQQAVLVVVVAILPVATQMGYNPFVTTLVVLALSNSWILPHQNSMYMTVHSGTEERAFTHRQVRPLAIAHSFVGLVAVLMSVPFWQLLGLIPR